MDKDGSSGRLAEECLTIAHFTVAYLFSAGGISVEGRHHQGLWIIACLCSGSSLISGQLLLASVGQVRDQDQDVSLWLMDRRPFL